MSNSELKQVDYVDDDVYQLTSNDVVFAIQFLTVFINYIKTNLISAVVA